MSRTRRKETGNAAIMKFMKKQLKRGIRSQHAGICGKVRPPRNYGKLVQWSGYMNKEIFLIYKRANPTERGYQKLLKALLDESYFTLNNMTARHFTEQMQNIKIKNLLSEIDRKLTKTNFETYLKQTEENTRNDDEHSNL